MTKPSTHLNVLGLCVIKSVYKGMWQLCSHTLLGSFILPIFKSNKQIHSLSQGMLRFHHVNKLLFLHRLLVPIMK